MNNTISLKNNESVISDYTGQLYISPKEAREEGTSTEKMSP